MTRGIHTGNPILPVHAADPYIAAFEGEYFIYASDAGVYSDFDSYHGGRPDPEGAGFAVWCSRDLTSWRNGGRILSFNDVSWAKARDWAPAVICRNGRYYLYFCADDSIGVAVSDSPFGPFVDALGGPLVPKEGFPGCTDAMSNIDPWAYMDDDGQAYLYWGAVFPNDSLYVRRLASDMVSFEGTMMRTITAVERHIEAQCLFKRNGVYYLIWSAGDFDALESTRAYRLEYATATSPLGPWRIRANNPILSDEPAIRFFGPGHNGILSPPGTDDWYCCYHMHRGDHIHGGGADRRVCIDVIRFEGDGTITRIQPTMRGVAPVPQAGCIRLPVKGPYCVGMSVPVLVESYGGGSDHRFSLIVGGSTVERGSLDDRGRAEVAWRPSTAGFCRLYVNMIGPDGAIQACEPVVIDVLE